MSQKKAKKPPVEIVNKKAAHEYFLVDVLEAGIMLTGTEVKSVRAGHVSLNDSYCYFDKGELFVKSLYIKPYEFGSYHNHQGLRDRKLLLRKQELKKLQRRVTEKGMTIIPYRIFINERGLVKLEIALSRGKKSFDKRATIKEKDLKREMGRLDKW